MVRKAAERAVFVSLLQACNNHFCVCSLFAGEGESRREHRSMWVHLLCSNQTAFFKICHVVLHDKIFLSFFFLLLLFWHALWFSDCWEMLLGSNSNLNGSRKMDRAAGYGEDLWWWYNCDNLKKSHLLLHRIYCSTLLGGGVWKHVRFKFWKHFSCQWMPRDNLQISCGTGRH